MFPDRASLYVVAIEDRQYKDYKIHCEYTKRESRMCVCVRVCALVHSDWPAQRISSYYRKKK